MKRKELIANVFVLFLSSTSLHAADFYFGAGLSADGEAGSFRGSLENLDPVGEDDAWKVFAGGRFGDHLAVEVSRYDFGSQFCCDRAADLGFTSEVKGVAATALGRWPLGRFAPFVKAGALYWKEDGAFLTFSGEVPASADGTDLLVGAGLEVDLPASFTVRADWERYEFGSVHTDGYWASLLFRF